MKNVIIIALSAVVLVQIVFIISYKNITNQQFEVARDCLNLIR